MSNIHELPKVFKIKTPVRESLELKQLYDFLFDVVVAGWAGRIGHYAYDDDPMCVATDQDGYIYCWADSMGRRYISASCKQNIFINTSEAVEINSDGVTFKI